MVVTARARHRQPHRATRADVDAVVNDVVLVVDETATERQESQRGDWTVVVTKWQFIGGDLLNDELVIRQIFIERADDVIAIGVRIRKARFFVAADVTLGVRVTRHVEPMPRPTFAVLRRGEETIYDFGECPG